ncbi:LOW QUALITY PROTEIN: hypothetical protein PHPALM_27852 [Phytophthora palmivora]|uniref:Uncharacterized protein n=1 Tax=Phytophthora palmivora TaxID=4796 RepID=A0A2P4XBJ3_9STRA|nr:LOW QUALITY PROTEIN: hypothetical protein PHPALM_27852 [Phytophthora palmivora]
MRRNVLLVEAVGMGRREFSSNVTMATLDKEEKATEDVSSAVKKDTHVEFRRRLGQLNYACEERLVSAPSSGIEITDHRLVNYLTCSERKLSQNRQSNRDTGDHTPIGRSGRVICTDQKCSMTPRNRLNNRYMINFINHKRKYCRVFLARTMDAATKRSNSFWCTSRRDATARSTFCVRTLEVNARVFVLQANGRYSSEEGSSEPIQQGKGQQDVLHDQEHGQVHDICLWLITQLLVDAVRYAVYKSLTNSNLNRPSPLKVLKMQTPSRGEFMVFGPPCTAYCDPKNNNFSSLKSMECRVYLHKGKDGVTPQHARNIDTLDKMRNELYFAEDKSAAEEKPIMWKLWGGDREVAAETEEVGLSAKSS